MSTARPEPEWVRHALWWHVYPLGFTGAPIRPFARPGLEHRLGHLERWLDHLIELGLSGLALGPVFASESHGYDTTDHYAIDPRLGDLADFDALVAAAHERGIRVMLDGVFNHVGRAHPAFQDVLAHGPSSAYADWFRLEWPGGPSAWAPGVEPGYADFEGHGALVALNHAAPAVVDLVADVMSFWLDRGADAWRLDAAYAVPLDFWAAVAARVRSAHPEAYLMGEVIHGDYASFVRDGGLDSVTQYELWKATWSSLNDRNLHELAHCLGRHAAFLDEFVPFTFIGNHDVTRIASRLTDARHLEHAVVLLATLPGTPAVYYGDEHAFPGIKEDRAGGDDAVRQAFPASPSDLAGVGAHAVAVHRELLALRRRLPWLHDAAVAVLSVTDSEIVYACSGDGEAERALVALSVGDGEVTLAVPGATHVLAGSCALEGTGPDDAVVRLGSHGWCVLAG
ncbi:alpha-amylase family glycosyl hydrolase [Demequina salsinemoris]|uniref:alpha-amylase family glycosyl hydrolase n=1 Tax=Demequina salsinemoris TaxID=577470 RepID=UPI0007840012|nr:alpha-amylase family glycosyl hydrolase [Demequina salsinemoris]